MMSYPPEQSKGRYISWFWIIFNMGAVIGSLVGRFRCHGINPILICNVDPARPEH